MDKPKFWLKFGWNNPERMNYQGRKAKWKGKCIGENST
jgi:hypothetical protein